MGCRSKFLWLSALAACSGSSVNVADKSNLPTCSDGNNGAISYVVDLKQYFICQSGAWALANIGPSTPVTAPTLPPPAVELALTTPEPAGSNCRYGGTLATSGIDKNGDGKLTSDEVASSIYVCEDSIDTIAKATFVTNVYSIGLVIVNYDYLAANCDCGGVACTAGTLAGQSAGTGWVFDTQTVVTNQHVVANPAPCPEFGAPGFDVTAGMNITSVNLYLPKTTLDAQKLLTEGLPDFASWTPSSADFDTFAITMVDDTPTTAASPAEADMRFLQVTGSNRTPLVLSSQLLATPTADSLSLTDEVFTIGFPLTEGPKLSIATVFQIQLIQEWFLELDGGLADTSVYATDFHVNPNDHRILSYGYGDHGGSGSPVFDRFGAVVGLNTWGADPSQTPYDGAQLVEVIKRYTGTTRNWQPVTTQFTHQ